MDKTKQLTILAVSMLLFPLWLSGQDPSEVRFVNAGKMAVAANGTGGTSGQATLYVPHSVKMEGPGVSILQNGITAIDGNFNNEVTFGNVFNVTSLGLFRFRGTMAEQFIQGNADRTNNYIDFPDVEVKNKNAVSLVSSMAMNSGNLYLTQGKLILRSTATSATETQLAHLLVKEGKTVTYNTDGSLAASEKGVIEVELDLADDHADYAQGRFFGFSSPYKKMYTDYFTFNIFLAPTAKGYAGAGAITDLNYALQSGKGYFIGHDIFPCSTQEDIIKYYKPKSIYPSIQFNDRMKNMLRLNRYMLEVNAPSIAYMKSGDAYSSEQINTSDVLVTLERGYNYLGNPFTAPLNLTGLTDKVSNATADPWQITRSNEDTDAADLYTTVWIPSVAKGVHKVGTTSSFTFSTTFDVVQKEGSTLDLENGEFQLEPMQMFMVWAEKASTITIPLSERTYGNKLFLRSGSRKYTPDDELLIEVKDLDTNASDRACVVFRQGASLKSTDPYDAGKVFNRSGGISQIYNRSTDGKDLTVNVVSSATESMPLNLLPASDEKEVELSVRRLETLHSPQVVVLEDRKTGTYTDLQETDVYRFQTTPQDASERFVLHFVKSATGKGEIWENALSVYYNNGTLSVTGLTASDAGSQLTLSDVGGRLVLETQIPDHPAHVFETAVQVPQGIYIVKVSGKRNLTTKLICK